jgi:hypothetical protein
MEYSGTNVLGIKISHLAQELGSNFRFFHYKSPMKKPALSFVCLIVSFTCISQYNKEVVLKWAPGSLTVGKLTLGGEYNFKKKN